jgi:pre-rRNA-processing protein TSR1
MKVPKGTSDYQATWIVDEEDENGEEDEESTDDEEDEDLMMEESIDGEDLDSQVVSSESTPHPGTLTRLHRRNFCMFFWPV